MKAFIAPLKEHLLKDSLWGQTALTRCWRSLLSLNNILCFVLYQVYIILAKPERNVRSAFTTSTVVRMHVGDGKSSSAASRSSSLVNLWKRRGSTGETLRYACVCLCVHVCVHKKLLGQVNARLLLSYSPRHHFCNGPTLRLFMVHACVCVCVRALSEIDSLNSPESA